MKKIFIGKNEKKGNMNLKLTFFEIQTNTNKHKTDQILTFEKKLKVTL